MAPQTLLPGMGRPRRAGLRLTCMGSVPQGCVPRCYLGAQWRSKHESIRLSTARTGTGSSPQLGLNRPRLHSSDWNRLVTTARDGTGSSGRSPARPLGVGRQLSPAHFAVVNCNADTNTRIAGTCKQRNHTPISHSSNVCNASLPVLLQTILIEHCLLRAAVKF